MKEDMKSQFWVDLVRVLLLGLVVSLGFGASSLWELRRFQKAYQANILSAQRQQIEATCEAIAKAAEKESDEDASEE